MYMAHDDTIHFGDLRCEDREVWEELRAKNGYQLGITEMINDTLVDYAKSNRFDDEVQKR